MINDELYGIKKVKGILKIDCKRVKGTSKWKFEIDYEHFDEIKDSFTCGVVSVDNQFNITKLEQCFYRVWIIGENEYSADLIEDEELLENIKKVIQEKIKKERVRMILGVET